MDLCQQGDARAAAALLMQIRSARTPNKSHRANWKRTKRYGWVVGWLAARFVSVKTLQTTFVALFSALLSLGKMHKWSWAD
jgi:hypothetical protein